MPKRKPRLVKISEVVFAAMDEADTTVRWDAASEIWVCRDTLGYHSTHHHLCSALTQMHLKTSRDLPPAEYKMKVPNDWRVIA